MKVNNFFFLQKPKELKNLILKGDIYSLGVSLLEVLEEYKIVVGKDFQQILEDMKHLEYEQRPSTQKCIERLLSYSKTLDNSSDLDIVRSLSNDSPFFRPPISDDFELFRGHIEKQNILSINWSYKKKKKTIIPK